MVFYFGEKEMVWIFKKCDFWKSCFMKIENKNYNIKFKKFKLVGLI